MMVPILIHYNILIIAHFVVVKVNDLADEFEVLHDIMDHRENNLYRFVRHASISKDKIVFCPEIG
jgi:acyl-CoA hydrolase